MRYLIAAAEMQLRMEATGAELIEVPEEVCAKIAAQTEHHDAGRGLADWPAYCSASSIASILPTAPEAAALWASLHFSITTVDFDAVTRSLRAEHARIPCKAQGRAGHFRSDPARRLDTGRLRVSDGFPGTEAERIRPFLAEDPLRRRGFIAPLQSAAGAARSAHRQPTAPLRAEFQGFFFHGIAKPNVTERRNALVEAHQAHLRPKDNTNCLARGGLTEKTGKEWFGSAMVYEFPNRADRSSSFSPMSRSTPAGFTSAWISTTGSAARLRLKARPKLSSSYFGKFERARAMPVEIDEAQPRRFETICAGSGS